MTKNTVIDDAKSMASTLRSVRMTRPAEAIEKLIEAYLAQEGRIAELTKDAEPVAIVEGLINFDGRFALSYGAKVKVGDKLYTHPPAPELKPLSLDEIHQRYKNLRGNEPPHYIDIYRDAEAALGILRGGL